MRTSQKIKKRINYEQDMTKKEWKKEHKEAIKIIKRWEIMYEERTKQLIALKKQYNIKEEYFIP